MNIITAQTKVRSLPVIDGSTRKTGEKYSYTDALKIAEEKKLDFYTDPADFYFILNYFYSIFSNTGSNIEELSCAWFTDLAAKDDKTDRLLAGLIL